MAQYRKNKAGEWVVFGSVSEVVVGRVLVSKKDGTKKYEAVASVGKPFYADGRQMAYGYIAKRASKPVVAEDFETLGASEAEHAMTLAGNDKGDLSGSVDFF